MKKVKILLPLLVVLMFSTVVFGQTDFYQPVKVSVTSILPDTEAYVSISIVILTTRIVITDVIPFFKYYLYPGIGSGTKDIMIPSLFTSMTVEISTPTRGPEVFIYDQFVDRISVDFSSHCLIDPMIE